MSFVAIVVELGLNRPSLPIENMAVEGDREW